MDIIKKSLALVLVLIMCIGLLAGCNQEPIETTKGTTEGTTAATTEGTTGSTTPAAPLKNADIYPLQNAPELEVLVVNGTSSPYESREVVATWERATGVHINWKEVADNAAYTTSISGGDWTDVCLIASVFNKAQMYEFGQAGKVINFADYKDIMPNLWRMFDEIDGAYETVVNADGTIYSLPYVCNTTTVGSPIYYRTDMAKAAGLEKMPETIEEFMTWLKGWQDYYGKDGEFYCIVPYTSGDMKYAGTMANFFFPSFGELVKTGLHEHNGKVVLGAATEQYKLYLQFMNELYHMKGFYTDSFVADANFTKGLITEGKTGVATTMTHLTLNQFPSGEFDIYGLKPLTSEYWSEPHNAKKTVAKWATNCWISTECESIETACRWLDAFFAPQDDPLNKEGTIWSLTPWRGELGVNFEFVGENAYRSYCPEGYATHLEWISKHDITANYVGDVPYIDDANSSLSRKSYIMGECMDPYAQAWGEVAYLTLSSDDQDEYTDLWADIDTYIQDCHAAFIIGDMDIEADWDTYVSTLNKMGLDRVVEIYQNAYDAQN